MHDISAIILDDDALMLEIVRAMLEGIRVTKVRTFTSAGDALEALNVHDEMQVVLCDLNMPGMDGVEFIRHLAQRGFSGAIVVLSGEDMRTLQTVEALGRAHQLRVLGALQKPIDRRALIRLLETVHPGDTAGQSCDVPLSEAELCAGIDGDALVPFFQPQVNIGNRKIVSVEALARWNHPQGGLLGPAMFIPLAEQCGLISRLTDQMIVKAMRQWRQWHNAGLDLGVAVNVSMDCLSRIDFPDWIVAEARAVDMPLNRLVLEITESRLMQDMAISLDVLSRLCLKRVRLSIDDFGTAYSNMEKLQMLPFFELKIDRAFVHGSMQNSSMRAILESSAALGKRLGMQIVAEGVETLGDWACAEQAGCDLVQGFYVARPMSGDRLIDWAQSWK